MKRLALILLLLAALATPAIFLMTPSAQASPGATWAAPTALNTNAANDAGSDIAPQVTTDGGGNWVAVWYSNENLGGTIGTDYDILVSRSTDNGATWTAPNPLNSNAASDVGNDAHPQVTTDGGGNWLAVWHSQDSLGGTIGTDPDILVSRSLPAPVGGIAELPTLARTSPEEAGVTAGESGWFGGQSAVLVGGLAAAAVLAAAASFWYARRRWLRRRA